jgi:hypothetical protein
MSFRRRKSFLEDLAVSLWVCAIVLPLSILCSQFIEWQRFGDWPALSTESVWTDLGWRKPRFALDALQQLSNWFFALPASITIFVVGILVSILVSSIAASAARQQT